MENKFVTLAIHTFEKAQILKTLLESEGIEVFIHNVNQIQPVVSAGVRVRIKESDLPRALDVIEVTQFYKEEKKSEVDDNTKKILIPVDFSDFSLRTCKTGFEYANRVGGEVMLFHAYYNIHIPSSLPFLGMGENTFDGESMRIIHDKVKEDIENLMSVIKEKIKSAEFPDVKYDYTICEGLPEDEILSFAKEYRPMMILMGTRGKGDKKTDLIGSVTAEVIESTKNPVLVIPEEVTFESLKEAKNVAFATSFNQQDLVAFDRFVNLIKDNSPQIHLFNISTSKDEWNEIRLTGAREYLKKHYPQLDIQFTVLDDGDLLEATDKFVHEKNIDIISMTTYRRNIISRLFNPSIARRMLFHTNTALLVIPKR